MAAAVLFDLERLRPGDVRALGALNDSKQHTPDTRAELVGVILRVAPPAKAALAVGICSAGGSFGQFFIVPLAAVL